MTSHPSGRGGGRTHDDRLIEIQRPNDGALNNWAVYGLEVLSGTFLGRLPGSSQILSFTRQIVVNYLIGPPDFSQTGFHGSGGDAIGLIMVPSVYTGGINVWGLVRRALEDPDALPEAWGHTAIYVRHNGIITIATGFGPSTLSNSSAVVAGRDYATGRFDNALSMFNMVEALTIEFPLSRGTARTAATQLRTLMGGGPSDSIPGQLVATTRRMDPPMRDRDQRDLYYVTRPNNFENDDGSQRLIAQAIQNSRFTNCVRWAVTTLESIMGARLLASLARGRFSVLDLGPDHRVSAPNTSSQGRLIREVIYASNRNNGNAMILRGTNGNTRRPTVSSYPETIRVLYAMRTFFLITSVLSAAAHFYSGRSPMSLPTTVPRIATTMAVATTTQLTQEVTRLVGSVRQRNLHEGLSSLGVLGAAAFAIFAPGDNYGVLALMMGAYLIMALTNYFARRLR